MGICACGLQSNGLLPCGDSVVILLCSPTYYFLDSQRIANGSLTQMVVRNARVDRAREIYYVDKDTRFLHDVRQYSQ